MAISFNQFDLATVQNQGQRTLPTSRQQSAAPVLTQTSQIANAQNEQTQALTVRPVPESGANTATNRTTSSKDSETRKPSPPGSDARLSEPEKQLLRDLRTRDSQVRAHEQAHLGAAGALARGGPSFTTQRGPDGRLYAIGGEVSVDTSAVGNDPEATIRKAEQIRRAALAPADPSAQDLAVAAQATAQAQQARTQLATQRIEEIRTSSSPDPASEAGAVAEKQSARRPENIYREIEQQPDTAPEATETTVDVFA